MWTTKLGLGNIEEKEKVDETTAFNLFFFFLNSPVSGKGGERRAEDCSQTPHYISIQEWGKATRCLARMPLVELVLGILLKFFR